MQFVRIYDDEAMIQAVYDILRLCGEDMYENQGLVHWRTPYPTERIVDDCKNKEVYLAIEENEPIATFQLSPKDNMLELSKFGVLPAQSGQGIGGKCMRYMEDMCKARGFKGLCLDVYDQSKVAIRFYEKHGFLRGGGGTFYPLFPSAGDGEKAVSSNVRYLSIKSMNCVI